MGYPCRDFLLFVREVGVRLSARPPIFQISRHSQMNMHVGAAGSAQEWTQNQRPLDQTS